jgi:ketosteroid isomerase-like protein
MLRTKSLILVIGLALLLSGGAHADDSSTPHPLLQVERDRFAAMVSGDLEVLEEILSDDLVYTHSSGISESKTEFLQLLQSGDLRYDSIRPLTLNIRVKRGWAVVNGTLKIKARAFQQSVQATMAYTAVYERQRGRWRLVSWQSTVVRP